MTGPCGGSRACVPVPTPSRPTLAGSGVRWRRPVVRPIREAEISRAERRGWDSRTARRARSTPRSSMDCGLPQRVAPRQAGRRAERHGASREPGPLEPTERQAASLVADPALSSVLDELNEPTADCGRTRAARPGDHAANAGAIFRPGLRRLTTGGVCGGRTRVAIRDSAQPRAEGEGFEPSRSLHP